MTNIEKVKRILDAGHCVRITFTKWRCAGDTCIITSYSKCNFSYITKGDTVLSTIEPKLIKDCTIEVIQRIPTPYVAGDKVLVLSNPDHYSDAKQEMVWKVLEIWLWNGINYVVSIDGKLWYHFPNHCLAPAFDDEKDTDLKLSWKEVTVTIDGKEYTAVMK